LQLLSQQWFGNTGDNNSSACVILIKELPTNHILKKKKMTVFTEDHRTVNTDIQGDQKVSVHLTIALQKTRKNTVAILNSFNYLP
jgi:hypothetical protein